MILTITPNPAIDRSIEVAGYRVGGTHVGRLVAAECAGKGVNVSRVLAELGVPSAATGLLGAAEAGAFRRSLAQRGVAYGFVETSGDVRVNTTVLDPQSPGETHIRERGGSVSAAEVDQLERAVAERATPGSWVAACGSLPDGIDAERYARILATARARGARIALDSSGRGLLTAIHAKPDLLKPNLAELSELCGEPIESSGDVMHHARRLALEWGGALLVTLGEEGAMLVGGGYAFRMRCAAESVTSSVGAGDASLAGLLWSDAHHEGPSSQLRAAVAAGAAAVSEPTAGAIAPDRFHRLLARVEVVPVG
jgi:1-phosphofructokinase